MYALIIFDLDGTLTGASGVFLQEGEDYALLPGRKEIITAMHEADVALAIATNQGGVAFGHRSEDDVKRAVQAVADELGITHVFMCFNHPTATLERYHVEDRRRKPGPGMLEEAMRAVDVRPAETLMVGDREEDKLAAQAAGCDFVWFHEFFPVRYG